LGNLNTAIRVPQLVEIAEFKMSGFKHENASCKGTGIIIKGK
jgi:hypothetical protein